MGMFMYVFNECVYANQVGVIVPCFNIKVLFL